MTVHITTGPLVEMKRYREQATCCGKSAGLRLLFPQQAHKIGAEGVRHAGRTGAEMLVTACPFYKEVLAGQAGPGLQVFDLPGLVAEALEQGDADR